MSEKVVTFGGPVYECLSRYDRGDVEPFEIILGQLQDPESDYRKLNKLIENIRACAPLLSQQHVRLLRALLKVNWGEFPHVLLDSWLTTVQAIVVAQPVHLRATLGILLNIFRAQPKEDEEEGEEEKERQQHQCRTVHTIIDETLDKVPLAEQVLVDLIAEKLPSKHGSPKIHQSYVTNVLAITGISAL